MRLTASILASCAAAALALPLTFGAVGAQAATLMNGGFEHNLDNWTTDDFFVAVTDQFYHRDGNGVIDRGDLGMQVAPPYKAQEGDFFAVMSGDADGQLKTLTQAFSTDGGLFRGVAAFLSGDYLPYDDFGYVKLTKVGGPSYVLFSSSVSATSVGAFSAGYGKTDWTPFSQVIGAGDYVLEAAIANVGDEFQTSFLLLDDFRVTAIPEPSTWAVMLTGSFGVGAALRRRRTARA